MLLTDDFIRKYDNLKPPFTELGEFVYYRTYSRWLEDEGRRETWVETCRRAVEYNCGLLLKQDPDYPVDCLREEAEELFDNHFHLRQFVSGRTLWVGGTDVAEKFPLANFNCSFLVLDSFSDFSELFYLLMVGTGVGFRALPDDVDKFPKYRHDVNLAILPYHPKEKGERNDLTSFSIEGESVFITIGDSKEGWVSALDIYFQILTSFLYRSIKNVILDFNNVRPKGERLKTFGGTASGHESLKAMFDKVHKVMESNNGTMTSLAVLDIANIIGENVVVGGVRRTSEIGLFDPNDDEAVNAKCDVYFQDEDGNWQENAEISHRRMSNNSLWFTEKPTRERLSAIFRSIRFSGEPGFINAEALKKRRHDGEGVNPCGEILLSDKQTCNLTTVNVASFAKDGLLQLDELKVAMKLAARAAYRMTLVDLEIPEWSRNQQRDRLTGVSLTGWQDMVELLGIDKSEERILLSRLKVAVRSAARGLARNLGLDEPLLSTTIKPEGTLSQLPTVSSGLHYSHSPYYIRRVRINAHDPLVKVAERLGWVVKPEVGQEWKTCNTKVIEFPIKSSATKTKSDVSAIDQLENYLDFMDYYVEHNASITVTVKEDEWLEVEEWVWEHWDSIIGVTFLALSDHSYALAPYQEITEDEYLERKKRMKPFDASMLEQYEAQEFDLGEESCESGACPIR